MLQSINSISKTEHQSIHESRLFTAAFIWYSSALFLPEPNDPVLLAIQDSTTGDINFEIGFADWSSPYQTQVVHPITKKFEKQFEFSWYSQSALEPFSESEKIIAWATLTDIWKGLGNKLKVGSSYMRTACEEDPEEYTILPKSERKAPTEADILNIAKLDALQHISFALSPLGLNSSVSVIITEPNSSGMRETSIHSFISESDPEDIDIQAEVFTEYVHIYGTESENIKHLFNYSGQHGEA